MLSDEHGFGANGKAMSLGAGLAGCAVLLLGYLVFFAAICFPECAVLLLGYVVFLGIIFIAFCALGTGSRSLALASFLLAILPFCGLAFGLWRVSFWKFYGLIWLVGLLCSVAAMSRAYRPRQQTAPAKPPQELADHGECLQVLPRMEDRAFMLISLLIGFAMLLFFYCGWGLFNHTPVDPSLERKITRGMSKPEVEALLGPPSSRSHNGDVWWYSVRGKWDVSFQISFDEEGVYYAHEWDRSELVLR
jgi:hypothetical protein